MLFIAMLPEGSNATFPCDSPPPPRARVEAPQNPNCVRRPRRSSRPAPMIAGSVSSTVY